MAVKVPITVEGNLGSDPEVGQTRDGRAYARLMVMENDRQFDEEKQEWVTVGEPVFHNAVVFGRQAQNAAQSFREGDRVIVTGDLHFQSYGKDGQRRQGTQIVASAVGPSLRFATAEVHREPKRPGPAPELSATGPVATPVTDWPTVAVPS